MLLDQLRLERPVAIARDFDRNRALLCLQRLGPAPVTGVAAAAALYGMLAVAQVVGELGLQRSLNKRAAESLQQTVRSR
jgi:hypothetical protein